MKLSFRSALAATALIITAGVSHATTNGYTPATTFAYWDSYPSFVFSNVAAGSSSGITGTSLSQSEPIVQVIQGAGLYDSLSPNVTGTDIHFSGGNVIIFTLAGTANFTGLDTFTLQMKRASTQGSMAANYNPSLSIDGGTSFGSASNTFLSGSGDTTSSGGLYTTTIWSFNLPVLTGTHSFQLGIPSVGAITRGIDFIAVQAIPEPSTFLLAAAGLLACVMFRRRMTGRLSNIE